MYIEPNILKLTKVISNTIPTTYTPTGVTQEIDWSKGNLQILDLGAASGNVTLTYVNAIIGTNYILKVIQGATPRTLTYPTTKWNGATAMIPTTTNDAVDFITIIYDGTNYASYITNFA